MSADRTKTFLVESYVSQLDEPAAAAIAGRVEGAAAELRGLGLVWLRSVALLEEETCFCMFSARMIEHVIQAGERAGVDFDHITEVVITEPGT